MKLEFSPFAKEVIERIKTDSYDIADKHTMMLFIASQILSNSLFCVKEKENREMVLKHFLGLTEEYIKLLETEVLEQKK